MRLVLIRLSCISFRRSGSLPRGRTAAFFRQGICNGQDSLYRQQLQDELQALESAWLLTISWTRLTYWSSIQHQSSLALYCTRQPELCSVPSRHTIQHVVGPFREAEQPQLVLEAIQLRPIYAASSASTPRLFILFGKLFAPSPYIVAQPGHTLRCRGSSQALPSYYATTHSWIYAKTAKWVAPLSSCKNYDSRFRSMQASVVLLQAILPRHSAQARLVRLSMLLRLSWRTLRADQEQVPTTCSWTAVPLPFEQAVCLHFLL